MCSVSVSPKNNAARVTEWMKKSGDLYDAHQSERERLQEGEADSFCDLVIITTFTQDLLSVISMPPVSHKKGRTFVARSQDLDIEMNQLKSQIDLRDFVVPIDNLLEVGVANKALHALDQFVIEKAGTKIGFLYQDLIEGCLADLEVQYTKTKEQKEQKDTSESMPIPAPAVEPPEQLVIERQQKEKTRPSQSSTFEIVASGHGEASVEGEESLPPLRIFNVRASTASIFSTLFTKAQSRGSISWADFASAMSDLGFSIMPKFGSVYIFLPPDTMAVSKSFTVHRPHKSQVEGSMIIVYARRLKRLYGWSEKTFEVAR